MSRFSVLDLAALPEMPAIGELDYDAILEARLVELEADLSETFDDGTVAEIMGKARNLASSPTRYLAEAGASRELYMENRINEAIRSVFLSSARGAALDHIGADRGLVRKVLDDSDPDNPVLEKDEPFRARIQLVIEAWSPHGTEGAYVYWALDADDRVVDVAVYGPNHGVDPPPPVCEPYIVVLSSEGDGTASSDLLSKVSAHLMPDKRRPAADLPNVISASVLPYQIEAVLYVATPETAAAVQQAAETAMQGFLSGRIRIGRKLFLSSIAAALKVQGVVDVEVTAPAATIDVGPFDAPFCTGVSLTLESYSGGWRDV